MNTESRDIYEQIGNLFYAIAAEQHVKPLEVAELKLLISQNWSPRNRQADEPIISDASHWILVTIDTLQAANVPARNAYNDFARFYSIHPEVFTDELKLLIVNTCTEITKIFAEDNKAGNVHLSELKTLFKQKTYSKV